MLKGVDLERIGMDYARCQKHLAQIKAAAVGIEKKAASVFNQPYDSKDADVDEMIYSGFFSFKERARLESIRQLPADKIPWQIDDQVDEFDDQRAATLIQRYKARNFPESLSEEQRTLWQIDALKRLEQRYGDEFSTWFDQLNALREQTDSEKDHEILDQVEQFVMNKGF